MSASWHVERSITTVCIQIQYVHTNTVCIQIQYVFIQYVYSTNTVCIQYKYSMYTNTVCIQYKYSMYTNTVSTVYLTQSPFVFRVPKDLLQINPIYITGLVIYQKKLALYFCYIWHCFVLSCL